MKTPFELMVAPTGARLSKADHPALPITASEIAQTALACAQAGASAIHVHVRDASGAHSLNPAHYAQAIDQIRSVSSIAVQVSTEAADSFDVEAQRNCLRQVPATDASVSLREIARDATLFADTYQIAAKRGIDIQHILYDPDDVIALLNLLDQKDIPTGQRRAIFVLGRYATNKQSAPKDLAPFLKQLGSDHLKWSVCAFGKAEQDCLLAALNHGGQVRIGFENNRHTPEGQLFPDNAASVSSFVAAANAAGFQPLKVPA